jgi:predicted DNA repair protein MutK
MATTQDNGSILKQQLEENKPEYYKCVWLMTISALISMSIYNWYKSRCIPLLMLGIIAMPFETYDQIKETYTRHNMKHKQ